MRDALRPSSFSLITLAGVSLGRLLGGTVIVETIFNLPGMGRLIVQDGVIPKDFTIVQGSVLVIAALYVLVNTAVDISYFALDPRIRRGRR
jgi:peptide/nickel transport system permease protein